MFSDSRYFYLDYTPVQYPFTMVYKSELQTPTTACLFHNGILFQIIMSVSKKHSLMSLILLL
jgi:hypothetical protein